MQFCKFAFFPAPNTWKYYKYNSSVPIEDKSVSFFHFWIMGYLLPAIPFTVCLFFCLLEMLLGLFCLGCEYLRPAVLLCQCPLCFFPMIPIVTHNRVQSAVPSQRLAGIKEPSQWKESGACCVTTFCVLSSTLFFKRQEAICLQTKSAELPSPSLLPRKAKISLSGPFLICPLWLSCRAELYGMGWYV